MKKKHCFQVITRGGSIGVVFHVFVTGYCIQYCSVSRFKFWPTSTLSYFWPIYTTSRRLTHNFELKILRSTFTLGQLLHPNLRYLCVCVCVWVRVCVRV